MFTVIYTGEGRLKLLMPKSVGFCNAYFGDNVICRTSGFTFQTFVKEYETVILQTQNSLLVIRQIDNFSPVPSSHKRCGLRNAIIRYITGGDQGIREDIPVPDGLSEERKYIYMLLH